MGVDIFGLKFGSDNKKRTEDGIYKTVVEYNIPLSVILKKFKLEEKGLNNVFYDVEKKQLILREK